MTNQESVKETREKITFVISRSTFQYSQKILVTYTLFTKDKTA